jgi:transcriptional regulator with XRE-family HTH domain
MNVVRNIFSIIEEKNLNQCVISDALGKDGAVASRLMSGKRDLKVYELEIIAKALEEDVLYLLTYPDRYVKKETKKPEQVEAILQIKLQADKKEQILKLVLGDNNIEILNK